MIDPEELMKRGLGRSEPPLRFVQQLASIVVEAAVEIAADAIEDHQARMHGPKVSRPAHQEPKGATVGLEELMSRLSAAADFPLGLLIPMNKATAVAIQESLTKHLAQYHTASSIES